MNKEYEVKNNDSEIGHTNRYQVANGRSERLVRHTVGAIVYITV
jgi:hypothetical protein